MNARKNNPDNPHYPKKLAALVAAWEAADQTAEHDPSTNKNPITFVKKWLIENADKFNLKEKKEILIIDPQMMVFVNKMGKYYESFGIPRIGGQIIGLMLITESPVSPEDIQRILGVSRSSISTNLKMLLLGAGVEEVHVQGDRKSYYMLSDRAVEQSLLRKINSYDYLKEVIVEGIENLKKKGNTTDKLSGLLQWINLDKEVSIELLERWKNRSNKYKL